MFAICYQILTYCEIFFFYWISKIEKHPQPTLCHCCGFAIDLHLLAPAKPFYLTVNLFFHLKKMKLFIVSTSTMSWTQLFFSSYFVASCLFCSMVRFLFYIRSVFRVWCNWPRLEQESTDVSALWKLNVKQTNSLTYKKNSLHFSNFMPLIDCYLLHYKARPWLIK